MDVTFSNVLEGTRPYFMGLPKQAQAVSGSGTQPAWSPMMMAPRPNEHHVSDCRPSSATTSMPPRPPSEPLEPEPHIIHKATVMREAAEKRREQTVEDDEDPGALSPPSHIIQKPVHHGPPTVSPAPAPQAPSPSPARPPSAAVPSHQPLPTSSGTSSTPPTSSVHTTQPPTPLSEPSQYRSPAQRVQTPSARPPDHFAPVRPPDPYTANRPPEPYLRYHYDSNVHDGRGPPVVSPQPSSRQSPQTYARISSSLPQHASSRLRDMTVPSPPSQRYATPPQQQLLPNDRVPPIHHPHAQITQRVPAADGRSQYPPLVQNREPSPYGRTVSHYDRHPAIPQRKYDPQQVYSGYRPTATSSQSAQSHRMDSQHQPQYRNSPVDPVSSNYVTRTLDRAPIQQPQSHDVARYSHDTRKPEYSNLNRSVDSRANYNYPSPSTSVRYAQNPPVASVPAVSSSPVAAKTVQRPAPAPNPKANYEYPPSNQAQSSPSRGAVKAGYPNQQTRMTVSVTTLVNQMNQTKQKRESPLDLSVKTVKNSADSSTTQDDLIDSATSSETKTVSLQPRPSSGSRHVSASGYAESHKVDFAPDFTQYRERSLNHAYLASSAPLQQPSHIPPRYNGSYESTKPITEPNPPESRHHLYADRNKYSNIPPGRNELVSRIDLTRSAVEERRPDNRIRDDRHLIIEERKRPAGPIINNIPEKIVRYETWTADSRISNRMSHSAREMHELMSRPVYSYSSHKQFEAYQNEQKRAHPSTVYRDHHSPANHRYPMYPAEVPPRERHDYHSMYHDRNVAPNSRHIIQKIPQSHREIPPHHLDLQNGVPADKRVLSILRSSLETKQGFAEPVKPKQIPDLIVIDDVDDSVIEITDLTKDNDVDSANRAALQPILNHKNSVLDHHIQMPKAIDSIARDSEYQNLDSADLIGKSPENDVASRIRTKAELKVMPPSNDNSLRQDFSHDAATQSDKIKLLPKSQKQHLFNQIRQDSLRLESVIKSEKNSDTVIREVKTEPMNIDEIEKDAIKTECILKNSEPRTEDISNNLPEEDLDWANACDNFMEQLKSGCHKKKSNRRRTDVENNNAKISTIPKEEPLDSNETESISLLTEYKLPDVVIKKEPIDIDEAPVQFSETEPVLEKDDKIKFDGNEILELKCEPKELITSESIDDREVIDKNENLKSESLPTTSKATQDYEENQTGTVKKKKLIDRHRKENSKEKTKASKILKIDKNELEHIKLKPVKTILDSDGKNSDDIKSKISKKITLKELKEFDGSEDNSLRKIKDSKKESVDSKAKTTKEIKDISTEKNSTDLEKSTNVPKIKNNFLTKNDKNKSLKRNEKLIKDFKSQPKSKVKIGKALPSTLNSSKSKDSTKIVFKEESESTDDDEPLIKSKMQKEKEMKYQLLKDLSEKSAYVKLECFDVDMNKNNRLSIDSITKDREEKQSKGKTRLSRTKGKPSTENLKSHKDTTSDSDDDDVSVASRLRTRKTIQTENDKESPTKITTKSSPTKKQDSSSTSCSSTTLRKAGFGDGSDFHPGWEEELYKYKRSLRMPPGLIAIPRGRSGGPFVRRTGTFFSRGSTSLPDLDPAPLSPAPSSAPSAATDDIFARRQEKLNLDSDLESNSSFSAANRLHYDSEASTSTVFSSTTKKKRSSIVDVLIKKCGKRDDSKKKNKEKDEKLPKVIPKSSNTTELLPTPSLGLVKNNNKDGLSAKKEKLMEEIFYLGAFRKETVSAFRNAFIKNTDGLIGATEEFAPVVLKSRTRTESRVLKQRATIKEVFGDERPASAPPTCTDDKEEEEKQEKNEPLVEIKQERKDPEVKPKLKSRKHTKEKKFCRSNSIRDGLRSTIIKRNDAKGRLMRLKKRNSLMKNLSNKRMKDGVTNKIRKAKIESSTDDKDKPKDEGSPEATEGSTKKRLKRLFGRRKFSSGFDYIRKKKKIIRRDENSAPASNKIRRSGPKPNPESESDIHKEIKGWFINKSIGETHLHRAARLGYMDCVAYCLEKLEAEPSAKDNAGYTPLHFAAARGHVRIARLLLQYGADVSAAAQGGVRPLHEACENSHVEVIRLLLSYGADPLLGTYAGQTPEELAEGMAARFLRLHIADVQGRSVEPWRFPPPRELIETEELGNDPLSSPPPASPPPPPDAMVEIQCTEAPLPPFYSLKTAPGQPADGLWCLLQDLTSILQIKSKESLLKQIHCGSGSPKELLREIRTQEFLERAQCHQLLGAGEKVNVRASKVSLVRVTDKLRQLLKIETVLVS